MLLNVACLKQPSGNMQRNFENWTSMALQCFEQYKGFPDPIGP